MKKTLIITALLFVSSLGFSQSIKDFKVRNKLTVDVEFELADSSAIAIISDGDTLATTPWVRSEIEDSLTNYVSRLELVDTLDRYADTLWVQNEIHDSLSVATFLGLTDTESSFTAYEFQIANAGATALESPSGITYNDSLSVTGKIVAGEIKTPTILSNNFYVTLNRDTTDTGTWKYVISGDTLIWSVYDGAAWDVIQKLIND